jgi:hypothetical protein
MPDTTTDPITLAETRAERLQRIAEGYEIYEDGMPDPTVPGAAQVEYVHGHKVLNPVPRKHPRYVLVTQYGDKGNYRLRLGDDLRNIEQLAADAVTDVYGAEQPICYFDLDVLAGPEPTPGEGDKVHLTREGQERVPHNVDPGALYYVVGTETDTFDGEAYEKLYLSTDEGADYLNGTYDMLIDEHYVEVIESAFEDERMPVRYGLARIITQVVFNTVPTEL